MSEAAEQRTVIEWCDWRHVPVYHIPNGGSRDPREARNLKRQGVRPGVPDLCIPVARPPYHGLYIELKAGKNRPTEAQKKWIEFLRFNGYRAVVCYGAAEAIAEIERYIAAAAETNLYDVVEEHGNCTVQVLRNSVTGEESVGWWVNEP